uniref:Carboxypeptidase n=1 Tax=Plectus sambesii TaxID=2011161 RepID=A0A914WU84_9BILA
MESFVAHFTTLSFLFFILNSHAHPDEIKSLPGLSETIKFKHYAGLLKASDTDNTFYWFVEAQEHAAQAPLILWLNGGPGCSSVGGLIEELGPYLLNEDGKTLRINPYGWNKHANLLIFESPAGVGYAHSSEFDLTTNDDETADGNYAALKDFFKKFPDFRRHNVFITGESYAGIYLPTLMERILDNIDDFPLNIKGMAIGNGLLNNDINTDTQVQFSYNHGLIDQSLWETIETSCCNGCFQNCSFHNAKTGFCQYNINMITARMWYGGLNPYDMYRDCFNPFPIDQQTKLKKVGERFYCSVRGLTNEVVADKLERMMARKAATVRDDKDNKDIKDIKDDKDEIEVIADPICMDSSAITHYMNLPEVREALNIPVTVPEWTHCSSKVSLVYQKQYNDVAPQIKKAVNAGLRVLLYYGDTDMACNFLMGAKFSKDLGLALVAENRPWKVDGQIAGFVTAYKGLDYLTVKGTGHMVPQWKPKEAFHMLDRFLNGLEY